ncbi:hypothetical protein DPEC_G00065570 [Dallia pectoralis]|uniref:Uncharacterized protein n=1 Tax=Dallia pectoralis TaxID=75939 RepID=A0ACC2H857_DALPE|nr:hypothetical protein DPEC_G00065570 [Dallia pectoralis]
MENRQQWLLEPIQEEEDKDLEELLDEEENVTTNEEQEDKCSLNVQRPSQQYGSLDQSGAAQPQITMNKRGRQTSNRSSLLCWSESDEDLPTPQKPQAREGGRTRPPEKKIRPRRKRKAPSSDVLFPQWLVNLMNNIEEATTHELIVDPAQEPTDNMMLPPSPPCFTVEMVYSPYMELIEMFSNIPCTIPK